MGRGEKPSWVRVLLTVSVVLACLGIFRLSSPLFENDLLGGFLYHGFFCAMAVLSAILLKKAKLFRAKPEHLKSGWPAAWFEILLILLVLVLNRRDLLAAHLKITVILLYLGYSLLAMFGEEVLFRGLIQRTLHEFFGEDSRRQVLLAVFLSGLFFGISILIRRLSNGENWQSALLSALIEVFVNMYYGAVYYRTGKNVWFLMILRTLSTTADVIVSNIDASPGPIGLRPIVWIILFGTLTLVTLRQRKVEPLLLDYSWEQVVAASENAPQE